MTAARRGAFARGVACAGGAAAWRVVRGAAIGGVTLCLGACERASFSTLNGAGPEARALATLGWWLIGLILLIIIAMGVLIVWAAVRRRGTLGEHLPIDADGGKGWILIGGVALPVVVLGALFFVTLGSLEAIPSRIAEAGIELHVTGKQWWWKIDYVGAEPSDQFSIANELHVPTGEKVHVQVTSADVIHSFWVPKLFGKLDAIPGHTNHLVFEAEKPGVYWGECAEYCGVQHANMRLVVVVQAPEDYQAWLDHQREPAVSPDDPQLISGRNAFEQYACALCHRIRGTQARGTVAPDLTHFGSRRTIGAGALPNTRARLQAWIVDSQALKPGINMPKLSVFDGPTLNDLAAYLESLE